MIGEEAMALAIGGKYANVDLVRQRARAAISAYLAALKEAGWVCVPREPTTEMCEAGALRCHGVDVNDGSARRACGGYIGDNAATRWRAMLTAAPPAQNGDER